MKKNGWTTLAVLGLFLGTMMACDSGSDQYGDVKKTVERVARVMVTFVKEMDQADDGGAVASALNKFADEMVVLQPKMEELLQKYPQFQNPENFPPEVREILDKVENLERDQMQSVFMKATKFSDDADVAKAMQKIQEAMK
jgi:hypothetical protein